MRNFVKKQSGITLIALVVTIIVLIILAGVSINMLVGENGIITQAQRAAQETEQAKQNEEKGLQELEGYIDSSLGGETAKTVAEARGGMRYTNTTPITDDSSDTMYVPGGFKIAEDSATDISDGVVTTDGINEFVWIPVSSEELGEMYIEAPNTTLSSALEVSVITNVYSKLRSSSDGSIMDINIYKPGANSYREPDILPDISSGDASITNLEQIKSVFVEELEELGIQESSTNTEILEQYANLLINEYTETYESIKKYNGFYIGRYELTGTIDNPTTQKEQIILANQNWYHLKKACNNVISSEYAQSEMIYGNQWDRVLNWIVETGEKEQEEVYEDSSSWGNYNNDSETDAMGVVDLQVSGKNEEWKANNIYDLAGNAYEWTQEVVAGNGRVRRGR